jgi:hypothetical protein
MLPLPCPSVEPVTLGEGKPASEAWQNAATFAAGIILDTCRSSGGVCLAVPDDTISRRSSTAAIGAFWRSL